MKQLNFLETAPDDGLDTSRVHVDTVGDYLIPVWNREDTRDALSKMVETMIADDHCLKNPLLVAFANAWRLLGEDAE